MHQACFITKQLNYQSTLCISSKSKSFFFSRFLFRLYRNSKLRVICCHKLGGVLKKGNSSLDFGTVLRYSHIHIHTHIDTQPYLPYNRKLLTCRAVVNFDPATWYHIHNITQPTWILDKYWLYLDWFQNQI